MTTQLEREADEDGKVLAYNHLAGSCDCYGDDPCEDCQEFVEAFSIGYKQGRAAGVQSAIDLLKKLRPEHTGLGIIIHELKELVV